MLEELFNWSKERKWYLRYGARNICHTRPNGLSVSTPRGSRVAPAPPQGRGVGSDEADRLPQTVMDVQFGIPDPEIDSHVIR